MNAVLRRLRIFVRAFFRRSMVEHELDDELQFHLDRLIDRLRSGGMSDAEARAAALREFGNVSVAREESRGAHRVRLLDDFTADLRYAARSLRRAPAFTSVAVLTVALGVGANTAIFGAVDAVLFRSLPVRDPQALVFLSAVSSSGARFGGPPYPFIEALRERSRAVEGIAVFAVDHLPVVIDGRVEQVLGQVASANIHELVGVRAAVGRTLTMDDEHLSPPVAVLGHRFWMQRFGGNRNIIGRTIRYGDHAATIVGVTAAGFDGMQRGEPVDVTFPVTVVGSELLHDRETWWSDNVARLRPGVTRERAQVELGTIFSVLDRATTGVTGPESDRRLEVLPAGRGLERLRRQLAMPLYLLFGAVGAVLLIGCANIANLLAVRASARRRELAVRRAIGAGSTRLVKQLLTESVLLFVLGALAGLVVAAIIQRVLSGYLAVGRNPIVLEPALDGRLVGFAGALALASGVLAGLVPALRAGRGQGFTELRKAGGGGGRGTPVSRSLIVLQVALSIVVLFGGSLMIRTLMNLRETETGFRADGVVTISIGPLESAYPGDTRRQAFDEVLRRVRQMPEVQSASLSVLTPLSGRDRGRRVVVAGFEPRSANDGEVHVNYVSPGFFETLGIAVTAGRAFETSDDAASTSVVMLNETARRFYYSERSPIGTTLAFAAGDDSSVVHRIVGIAANSKHRSVRDDAPRFVYLPLAQVTDLPTRLTLTARSAMPAAVTAMRIQRVVEEVGAGILVSDVETLEQQVDRALLRERLVSTLASSFAVLGLLLAALGLYGVTAYSVVRRTDEIGIRMALGASPVNVRRLVLRESLFLGACGVGIGLPLGILTGKSISGLLYEVSASDPWILLACVGVLMSVISLAGYVPARRASRIDPVRALNLP